MVTCTMSLDHLMEIHLIHLLLKLKYPLRCILDHLSLHPPGTLQCVHWQNWSLSCIHHIRLDTDTRRQSLTCCPGQGLSRWQCCCKSSQRMVGSLEGSGLRHWSQWCMHGVWGMGMVNSFGGGVVPSART